MHWSHTDWKLPSDTILTIIPLCFLLGVTEGGHLDDSSLHSSFKIYCVQCTGLMLIDQLPHHHVCNWYCSRRRNVVLFPHPL